MLHLLKCRTRLWRGGVSLAAHWMLKIFLLHPQLPEDPFRFLPICNLCKEGGMYVKVCKVTDTFLLQEIFRTWRDVKPGSDEKHWEQVGWRRNIES